MTEHSTNPTYLRQVAEKAAWTAGEYVRGVFRQQMDISHKRDRHDLVTEHDQASEKIIVEQLLGIDPQWRIVGEEGGQQGGDSTVTWYIDPIDGTSNFAQGLAFFCVCIGVEVDGETVAGVVYDPMADRTFSADDAGAYLDGEPLVTPPALPQDAATVITGYPSARDLAADGDVVLSDFGELVRTFSSVRRTGSGALSLCHVAAGWVDSSFGVSTNPWDVAAASLIVTRAGGSYEPVWVGVDQPEGAAAHLAPGYIATGPDADYPVLRRVVDRVAARRAVTV